MADPRPVETVLARLAALHPRRIDLSLDRMRRLLARLGDPQHHLPPVIHVAGTNGKGSTIAMLRAMHEAAGRRVHVYTSPHLVRHEETVVIAGREVGATELVALLERCERINGGAPITVFEILTAAAFLAFAETNADLLLLEVGLGGTLDATNVVPRPALCVVTPVAMDHMSFLGEALSGIADAKAGILKPDVPAVVARQRPVALDRIRARAGTVGAPLLVEGESWSVSEDASGDILFRWGGAGTRHPRPALPGAHQIGNAGLALAAAAALGARLPLSGDARDAGLRRTRWPGRLQRLARGPLIERLAGRGEVWVDGAHNAHATAALAAHLAGWRQAVPGCRIAVVFGCLEDRDPAALLAPLAAVSDRIVAVPVPDSPRGLDPSVAVARAGAAGIPITTAPDVATAVAAAVAGLGDPVTVVVCGSLALAGSLLRSHA